MASHVLALDQGTTSSRAILFDKEGNTSALAQKEFKQHFPQGGWVEHDPREIWSTQAGVAAEALEMAGISAKEVAAIGITNQRETTLVWDRATGHPIYNAIVWQDRRGASAIDRLLRDGQGAMIQSKTGLVPDAYFSATKLAWILEHVDGAKAKANRGELCFGTVDAWLLWKLTGGRVHACDETNASRTMLYNITERTWDEELLELFGVPRSMLPDVHPSSANYGEVSAAGSLHGIPIGGVAGDQQSALMGQLCVEPGMGKNTYGTGCFLLMEIGSDPKPSQHRLLTTVAASVDGKPHYALEGSVFIAGAIVQWLRDGLGLIKSAADIEPLAKSVKDSDGVYLVPALAGLGAPHWDAYARGTICGITRGTTAGHFARAALEGIAFQVAELYDAMLADMGDGRRELRVDGGAAVNDTLMQIQADLMQAPIIRPKTTETTALGTAFLAGISTGFWKPDELEKTWTVDKEFEPQLDPDQAKEMRAGWNKAIRRAKG